MMAKRELIRVVRTPEGEVKLDLRGKMAGRGAYLCGSQKCFTLAKKSRAFDRALNSTITPEIYEQLQVEFVRLEAEFQAMKEQNDEA
jgi:predicted RNA-binding protein YlxR (DUF448 family)